MYGLSVRDGRPSLLIIGTSPNAASCARLCKRQGWEVHRHAGMGQQLPDVSQVTVVVDLSRPEGWRVCEELQGQSAHHIYAMVNDEEPETLERLACLHIAGWTAAGAEALGELIASRELAVAG